MADTWDRRSKMQSRIAKNEVSFSESLGVPASTALALAYQCRDWVFRIKCRSKASHQVIDLIHELERLEQIEAAAREGASVGT
jgi:hypothetical protein